MQVAAKGWSSKEDKWPATTPENRKATCCVWAEMSLLGGRKRQREGRRSNRKVNHNLPWAPWKFATVMSMLIARIKYRLCCEITPFLLSKTTPQKLTWILYLVLHHHSCTQHWAIPTQTPKPRAQSHLPDCHCPAGVLISDQGKARTSFGRDQVVMV